MASLALPAELDNAAFYEKQTVCESVARPGTAALRDLLLATYVYENPTIYITRNCTSNTSEHFDGRALDWMRSVRVAAEKEMADAFVSWLLAPAADGTPHEMARRLGIMYIIWDSRMIRMYDPGRGWTEYSSCLDPARSGPGLDTACHRDHVHLSMSWDGAAGITSWWTGAAQTQKYCSAAAASSAAAAGSGAPAVVADPATVVGYVPVKPTTILDTRAGLGAGLSASCRLLAGRALYPRAAIDGLVPAGAGAVVVRVTSTSNAPARLSVWSSGGARPVGQVATPIGTTSATVVLPLSSDGTIALSTSLGAANVTAKVIGFAPSSEAFTAGEQTSTQEPTIARPSKPRKVQATSARRAVRTQWKAPRTDGGAALIGYRVQALKSKKRGAKVAGTCTAEPTARSCRVKGLKVGRKYWMSVSVSNEVGSTWAARQKVRVR